MSFIAEAIDYLNQNQSVISILGWLTVFLLGIHTQKLVLKINFRWKAYKEYIDISTEFRTQPFLDHAIFKTQRFLHVIHLMVSKDSQFNDSQIWSNYLKEEDKDYAKLDKFILELLKKIELLVLVAPKLERAAQRMIRDCAYIHEKAVVFNNSLHQLEGKEIDIEKHVTKMQELDKDFSSFYFDKLTEFRNQITKKLFGNIFGLEILKLKNSDNHQKYQIEVEVGDKGSNHKTVHIPILEKTSRDIRPKFGKIQEID